MLVIKPLIVSHFSCCSPFPANIVKPPYADSLPPSYRSLSLHAIPGQKVTPLRSILPLRLFLSSGISCIRPIAIQ